MEKWMWIELIGFDNEKEDFAAGEFFARTSRVPDGVSLLISSCDFVNLHDSENFESRELTPMCCSYEAHPCNEERARQVWTGAQLKGLIRTLQGFGTRVFLSFFNMFAYRDENGEEQCEPFGKAHPELWEHRRDGSAQKTLHMLKRFSDGTYYEDFLAQKLAEVLRDYGFDGVQLADGISSARVTVQSGDYSDDITEQFVLRGGALPEEVLHKSERERGDYIYRYKLEEWLKFLSERWGGFYSKILRAIRNAGKLSVFNSCWTREPFEAYYRYGLDYRKIDTSMTDGCMVEEVSACTSIYGNADQGGFSISLEERALPHYEFWAMQLMMKKTMPSLKLYNLSSLKDTNEQWDVIRDAPGEYARAVYRDNSLAVWKGGRFVPTLSGAFFCLADGIKREEWQKIENIWQRAELEKGFVPLGCLAVSSSAALESELSLFLKTRNYPSHKILSQLLFHGAPIAGGSEPSEAKSYGGALLLLYPEFYSETEQAELLERTDVPVFTFGGTLVSKRKPDFVITHRGERADSIFAGYNVKADGKTTLYKHTRKNLPASYFEEREGALWTKSLVYSDYNKRFIKRIAATIAGYCNLPRAISERENVTVSTVKTADGKYRIYTDNRNYYYALPQVECGSGIESARSLTKFDGFRVPVDGKKMRLRIPPRGIEVCETGLSEKIKE